MRMKKSQLKEAVKTIVRECLYERLKRPEETDEGMGADSEVTMLDDVVKFVIKKLPNVKDPSKIAKVASLLFQHQYGNKEPDLEAVMASVEKHLPIKDTSDESVEESGLTSEDDREEHDYKGNEGEYIGGYVPGKKGKYKFTSQGQLDSWRRDNADPRLQPHGKQQMGENGDHDYDESEEIKLIKAMAQIAKKLEAMHKGSVKEASYKKVAPHAYTDAAEDKARRIQTEPEVNEAAYKVTSPNETDTAKENKALTIQTEPKVTENHKTQKRSYKTVQDIDNDPNNVRDPDVPQA